MTRQAQVDYTTALRLWVERWEGSIPPRERGESWGEYLQRLEDRLQVLEYAWGDWIRLGPPRDWIYDPHWAWAWPRARDEIYLLRIAIPELRRALKEVRHA